MKERVIGVLRHWFIMQIIYSQSPAGRARMKNLISLWMAVLAVIFALLVADIYVDDNKIRNAYTARPEALQAMNPAR